MFSSNFFSKTMTKHSIVLMSLYLFTTGFLISLYWFNYSENIWLFSIFFFLVLILNRLSLKYVITNNFIKKIIFSTELLFIVYIICILILNNNYFLKYKLLIIPSILLNLYILYFMKRIRK